MPCPPSRSFIRARVFVLCASLCVGFCSYRVAQAQPDVAFIAFTKGSRIIGSSNSGKLMPAASSIKMAILLAYFTEFQDRLDDPVDIEYLFDPGKAHPALLHLSDTSRSKIHRDLQGKTVREIGWIMIQFAAKSGGGKFSNHTYNAASNVAIAELGGPKEATRKIRALHRRFEKIEVNRYMLASREEVDNVAAPSALASVFHILHYGRINGLSPVAQTAAREISFVRTYSSGAKLYAKGGNLRSDPVTIVRCGLYLGSDGRPMSYAIMASQPVGKGEDAEKVHEELSDLTLKLYERAVASRPCR